MFLSASFCVFRCGTMFAQTEAEAATTPIWRRTEGAPSGTTRKRWTKTLTKLVNELNVLLGIKCHLCSDESFATGLKRFRLICHIGRSVSCVFISSFSPLSQLLSEIEEHLKCTITQCEPDIKIPLDEFDGKVTYGQRRALGGTWISVTGCKRSF